MLFQLSDRTCTLIAITFYDNIFIVIIITITTMFTSILFQLVLSTISNAFSWNDAWHIIVIIVIFFTVVIINAGIFGQDWTLHYVIFDLLMLWLLYAIAEDVTTFTKHTLINDRHYTGIIICRCFYSIVQLLQLFKRCGSVKSLLLVFITTFLWPSLIVDSFTGCLSKLFSRFVFSLLPFLFCFSSRFVTIF